MSFDLNKVMLIGRVGKDPEVKQVSGKNLASFSLATSYGTGDKQRTEWHQIAAWEKLADQAVQYLRKGNKVFVEGRLSYNTIGEGESRKTFTQITAVSFINLAEKPAGASSSTNTKSTNTAATQTAEIGDEDIPF